MLDFRDQEWVGHIIMMLSITSLGVCCLVLQFLQGVSQAKSDDCQQALDEKCYVVVWTGQWLNLDVSISPFYNAGYYLYNAGYFPGMFYTPYRFEILPLAIKGIQFLLLVWKFYMHGYIQLPIQLLGLFFDMFLECYEKLVRINNYIVLFIMLPLWFVMWLYRSNENFKEVRVWLYFEEGDFKAAKRRRAYYLKYVQTLLRFRSLSIDDRYLQVEGQEMLELEDDDDNDHSEQFDRNAYKSSKNPGQTPGNQTSGQTSRNQTSGQTSRNQDQSKEANLASRDSPLNTTIQIIKFQGSSNRKKATQGSSNRKKATQGFKSKQATQGFESNKQINEFPQGNRKQTMSPTNEQPSFVYPVANLEDFGSQKFVTTAVPTFTTADSYVSRSGSLTASRGTPVDRKKFYNDVEQPTSCLSQYPTICTNLMAFNQY